MTTAVATTKDFQERMFERIRDQMGDLLTDEDLKKLVDASIAKAFFEPVIAGRDTYGRENTKEAPYLTMIRELLRQRVDAAVKEWLEANPGQVEVAIKEAIGKGMLACVSNYIESRVQGPLWAFAEQLKQKGVLS